jgi:hypothetical protein
LNGASKARRRYRREEWREHTTLARLLTKHLDPQTTFWTSLENKPSSLLNGLLQKKRGVRSGLPDVMAVCHRRSVFVELKSRAGVLSKSQRQVREELLRTGGAHWWMARSARAAMTAFCRSGVKFRSPWSPPADLQAWEGPFTGEEKKLPRHPAVRERQREVMRRWRVRRAAQGLPVWRPPTEERRATQREYTRRWRAQKRTCELDAAATERVNTRDQRAALRSESN